MAGTPRITDDQLIEFAAGLLDSSNPGLRKRIEKHLQDNLDAAQLVHQVRAIKAVLGGDDSVAPTEAALRRAKAVFTPLPTSTAKRSWLEAVDRIVARLVFDSRVQPLAVRFVDAGSRFNLSYRAGEGEIDLQAERQAETEAAPQERWTVMGQVSGVKDVAGLSVILTTEGRQEVVAETVTNPHGEFTLQAMAGSFDVHIAMPEGVAVLSNVQLA
jgi:hypothetical protein